MSANDCKMDRPHYIADMINDYYLVCITGDTGHAGYTEVKQR